MTDIVTLDDVDSFCRREWPRLVGTLSLFTGDADLAEELAQETLARVCRDWRKVSSLEAPGAWAHRVAINLARSHFRHRAVVRKHASALLPTAPVDDDTASALAVRAAVARLPVRQRTALVLRYFADLSVAETAEVMRCPTGTVKTLTRQAILALRNQGLVTDAGIEQESMADVE
ncbi:MAG TPA: SigE family RNA polymerase sigma factor [Acidimicrobiia bacterium]|jgi:RNA polymerase sigma-70 factor (sigma-E family)|nr:SigE family RNA polymerase sigma factor [Acidimicrobiia bacterium]